jgi:hypothetical protein
MEDLYYAHFENEANHGRLLDADFSTIADLPAQGLHEIESSQRIAWQNMAPQEME